MDQVAERNRTKALNLLMRHSVAARIRKTEYQKFGLDRRSFVEALEHLHESGKIMMYVDDGYSRVTAELTCAGMAEIQK